MIFLLISISLSISLIFSLLTPFIFSPLEYISSPSDNTNSQAQKSEKILREFIHYEKLFELKKISQQFWDKKKEELQKKYLDEKTNPRNKNHE